LSEALGLLGALLVGTDGQVEEQNADADQTGQELVVVQLFVFAFN